MMLISSRKKPISLLRFQGAGSYSAGYGPVCRLKGRKVIVVDDGIATGGNHAGCIVVGAPGTPERIIAASPVGSEEAVTRLTEDADEVVCLRVPPFFAAVGQFYMRLSNWKMKT